MGLAKIEPPVPKEYLRRKPHTIWPPKTNQMICKDHKKPPIPRFQKRHSSDHKIECCPSKNFIVENIAKAKKKMPDNKPLARIVDTCRGNTFLLIKSGLDPIHMKSPDFGKTPKYLEKRKREISQNISKESKVESMKPYRYISDEERLGLLEKLIEKRELLMKRFMLLPLVTDTISKVLTKSTLENKLAQLDKDINMVDTHQRLAVRCDKC